MPCRKAFVVVRRAVTVQLGREQKLVTKVQDDRALHDRTAPEAYDLDGYKMDLSYGSIGLGAGGELA